MKAKTKEFDMGKTPVKSLFRMIWIPTMISTIIGGTFIVFDTMFISHGFHAGRIASQGVGWYWATDTYASLGATGMSYVMPYTLMMVAVAMMLGGGLATKITRENAKGNRQQSQRLMNSHLPIAVFYGAILTIVIVSLAKVLVWTGGGFQQAYLDNWFNNPLMRSDWAIAQGNNINYYEDPAAIGHLFSQASWYLRIQGLAAIPYVYMYASGLILRVEGKTHVATYVNVVALGANIVLDTLFINVFGMNMVGAAIATVVAEVTGMIIYYFYFKYKFPLRANKPEWKFAFRNSLEVSKNGTSSLALQLNSALMILVFSTSIGFVNYGNMTVINGYTSAFQSFFSLYMLANLVVIGTTISIGPIITYNAQKGNIDRSLQAKRIGYWAIGGFAIFFTLLIFLFPIIITQLFNAMPADPGYAQRIAQILVLGFSLNAMILMAGIYFQSLGENKKANSILYAKPIMLWIIVLILGFSLNNSNGLGAWQNSILPWNSDIEGVVGIYSIGLFWGLPIVDLILGSLSIYFLTKNTKEIKEVGFKYLKNVNENI